MSSLLATAIHESGHAVLAHLLESRDVGQVVTIVPTPEKSMAGSIRLRRLPQKPAIGEHFDRVMDRALVLLGGSAAELLLAPDKVAEARASARLDDGDAREVLADVGRVTSLEPLRAEAGRLLAEHWRAVRAVARELLMAQPT